MVRAKEVGEEAYKAFREQSLECDPPNVEFHDAKKKAKLKTFAELNEKITVKASYNQSVVPKAERRWFAEMIVIAESRNFQMSEVLAYPVRPLAWKLAKSDSTLHLLSKGTPEECTSSRCCSPALSMRLKGDQKT